MPTRIDINGLDIKNAMGGVRVALKNGLSIRITDTQNENEFEIYCDVRMPDGAMTQESETFYITNGKVRKL